jgi:signal peptidase I
MSDELDLKTEEPIIETAAQERHDLPPPEVRTMDVEKKEAPDQAFKKSLPREYFESIVVTLIMALFGMTFIVQAVKVPTGSMKNTIWIQDHLLVNKFIFGPHEGLNVPVFPTRDIRRGDIVVFKFPNDPQTNFVKRVIGLPGETIEYRSGKVYINGQVLPEREVFVKTESPDASDPLEAIESSDPGQGAQWSVYYYENRHGSLALEYNDDSAEYGVRQPFKVPVKGDPVPEKIRSDPSLQRIYDGDGDGLYDSDQYFCMGDNRDNSLDSRFWGTVPRSSIVGRAMFVYWSIDTSPDAGGNFFTRSRWWRTGKFIK